MTTTTEIPYSKTHTLLLERGKRTSSRSRPQWGIKSPAPVAMLGTITSVKRLTSSAQGNPMFRVTLSDPDTFGTYTATTDPGSAFGYVAPTLLDKRVRALIRQDKAVIVSAHAEPAP